MFSFHMLNESLVNKQKPLKVFLFRRKLLVDVDLMKRIFAFHAILWSISYETYLFHNSQTEIMHKFLLNFIFYLIKEKEKTCSFTLFMSSYSSSFSSKMKKASFGTEDYSNLLTDVYSISDSIGAHLKTLSLSSSIWQEKFFCCWKIIQIYFMSFSLMKLIQSTHFCHL